MVSSHVPTLKHETKHRYITGKFVCLFHEAVEKAAFWVICPWVRFVLSVGTREDTSKCLASFISFKRSVYCIFWQIFWVKMFLHCSQPAGMSAMSSSSQGCNIHHNNAVEHCTMVNILIVRLNVQKTKLLLWHKNSLSNYEKFDPNVQFISKWWYVDFTVASCSAKNLSRPLFHISRKEGESVTISHIYSDTEWVTHTVFGCPPCKCDCLDSNWILKV